MVSMKVEREKLKACMTCPLCNNLFTHATTITECLHTFCKKCIYDKITEEDFDTCPVCSIGLGCAPLEKLRADNNLQELRLNIFASKAAKRKAATTALPSSHHRKKKSSSSLSLSSPTRGSDLNHGANGGTAVPNSHTLIVEESGKNVVAEDRLKIPKTLETLVAQNSLSISLASSSEHSMLKKTIDGNVEQCPGMSNFWKSLNFSGEATTKAIPDQRETQNSIIPYGPDSVHDTGERIDGAYTGTIDVTKAVDEPKENSNGNVFCPPSFKPLGRKKLQSVRPKGTAALGVSQNAAVEAIGGLEQKLRDVWFILIASENQKTDRPLPQIARRYLRVKDNGSLTVSKIKKYLVEKLSLVSEDEVEISFMGQPVVSTLLVKTLLDGWVQSASAFDSIRTFIGSSAKDVVIIFTYSRKIQL